MPCWRGIGPIRSHGTASGGFYLADKHGDGPFSPADQRAVELLAAHAAVAIDTARQHERSRELTVVEERNRLARELHDAVTQRLFSATLVTEAAATLAAGAPAELREQIDVLRALVGDALGEMRALVFELRPADVGADGLVEALRKHAEVLRRVHGVARERGSAATSFTSTVCRVRTASPMSPWETGMRYSPGIRRL